MEKELIKTPWKIIIGWCPVCWWRQSNEFHMDTAESTAQRTIRKSHLTAKPNCNGVVRFEPAVPKKER